MSQPIHFSEGPGTRPFTTLAAVTADGNGTVCKLGRAHGTFGMQVVLGGAVAATGGTITLEGSIDGTNFDSLGAVWTIGTDTSGDIKFAVDKPVAFVRTVLASLAGGTNPTVTATVVAV